LLKIFLETGYFRVVSALPRVKKKTERAPLGFFFFVGDTVERVLCFCRLLLCTCGEAGVLGNAKLEAGTKSSLFGAGAEFGIGTRLLFFSKQKRLRGGRLLFPLRRKK
jgi:hypothetical protein